VAAAIRETTLGSRVMKKRGIIHVDSRYCSGCRICVEFCPRKVLELSPELNHKAVHVAYAARPEDCTACNLCEIYCPDFAIAVEERELA
jgi:2-oxoglutarate ferredoxin oxidoreductase subunit delta